MDLIDQTNVLMAYLERRLQLGGEQAAKTELRGLDGDALSALLVERLIDDAHAAMADLPDDLEAMVDDLP